MNKGEVILYYIELVSKHGDRFSALKCTSDAQKRTIRSGLTIVLFQGAIAGASMVLVVVCGKTKILKKPMSTLGICGDAPKIPQIKKLAQ